MTPPRRALIAVTSAHAPLYPGGKETGFFITEALHAFNVFRAAGFEVASLIGCPDAKGLQEIASKMYTQGGGILSVVCHGRAIFSGKKVTGFTTRGEEEGVLDTTKSWKRPKIGAAAKDARATYMSPPCPWDLFAYTDGRIMTGTNPTSAHKTAEEAVKAVENL